MHGRGILGSQGKYNRKHRQLCQPPFRSPALLDRFCGTIVERAERLNEIYARRGGATEGDVAVATQRMTLDIIGQVAFSHDFGQLAFHESEVCGTQATAEQRANSALVDAVNSFGEELGNIFITPKFALDLMKAAHDPHIENLESSVETIRSSMLELIRARRAELSGILGMAPDQIHLAEHGHRLTPSQAGPSSGCPFGFGASGAALASMAAATEAPARPPAPEEAEVFQPRDLLDMLLMATDEHGEPMSEEELWEDVHDVMGAGHETTATTTAALLYSIVAHPEVYARVQAEVDRVLGDRPATFADAERLTYLDSCVKEVLRLYPAIPLFPRVGQDADTLPSGYDVPAGEVVLMSPWALGRSARLWEDPLVFKPERFDGAEIDRFKWAPFGAGPRMCLGANFAILSLTLSVATLLQRTRFECVSPTTPLIDVGYDMTMQFKKTRGLQMRATPRALGLAGRASASSDA